MCLLSYHVHPFLVVGTYCPLPMDSKLGFCIHRMKRGIQSFRPFVLVAQFPTFRIESVPVFFARMLRSIHAHRLAFPLTSVPLPSSCASRRWCPVRRVCCGSFLRCIDARPFHLHPCTSPCTPACTNAHTSM